MSSLKFYWHSPRILSITLNILLLPREPAGIPNDESAGILSFRYAITYCYYQFNTNSYLMMIKLRLT
jgi:hypothetical protein